MFSTSGDYHQLNSGAHRRTNLTIEAPALTCHLGFWAPKAAAIENFERWKVAIDHSIIATLRRLKDRSGRGPSTIGGHVDDPIVLFEAVVTKDLNPVINTERRNINDAKGSDFRNICLTFQFDNAQLTVSYELHTEYLTITLILQVLSIEARSTDSKVQDVVASLGDLSKFLRGKIDTPKDCAAKLYDEFWSGFIKDNIDFSSHDGLSIGEVFADFRGIIISDETRTFRDQFMTSDPARSAPQWGDAAIADLQSVIGDVKNEITASYMLAGRALYLTNLGPQISHSKSDKHTPTKYIIYVHQKDLSIRSLNIVNRWQLGRLIDRLHWLGIHRLAALRNLTQLRTASHIFAGLSQVVTDMEMSSTNREIYEAMQSRVKGASTDIIGGIQYRTERSRYYVSNFRRMVSNLRIVRVEGYQPYDIFIEQRLGAIFNFIDRLGIRYERAQKATARRREDANFDEIVAIQRFGEAALLIGLAPYYLSHLVDMSGFSFGFTQFVTFSIWSAGIVVFLYRRSVEKNRPRVRATIGGLALLIALLGVFVVTAVVRHNFIQTTDWKDYRTYLTIPAAYVSDQVKGQEPQHS